MLTGLADLASLLMSYATKTREATRNNTCTTQPSGGVEARGTLWGVSWLAAELCYATLTQSMGNMRQCSMIPATAPANMWVLVEAPWGRPS